MRPEIQGRERRHLRIQPDPDTGPVAVRGQEADPSTTAEQSVFTEAVVRAGWSMRLHALLGEELARGVDAGVLSVPEAEVLLARLVVVIDQAVGAGES